MPINLFVHIKKRADYYIRIQLFVVIGSRFARRKNAEKIRYLRQFLTLSSECANNKRRTFILQNFAEENNVKITTK